MEENLEFALQELQQRDDRNIDAELCLLQVQITQLRAMVADRATTPRILAELIDALEMLASTVRIAAQPAMNAYEGRMDE